MFNILFFSRSLDNRILDRIGRIRLISFKGHYIFLKYLEVLDPYINGKKWVYIKKLCKNKIFIQILVKDRISIKRHFRLQFNLKVNKTLVILFSIYIITSPPVLEEFYYGDVDYDGYISIIDILYIFNAIDDELSHNFLSDYNNDNSINVNDIYSNITSIFGLGL